jgi:hemerythrin-like domain-containing protein
MANRSNGKGRAKRQQPKNAVAMLKADHQKVRDIFQQYASATDFTTKRELAEAACTELEIHAQLEEQIFYPAVNEETDEGPDLVKEAVEEHQLVKDLIEELGQLEQDHKAFDATFKKLIKNVEHHIKEEETEMFPLAEAEMGDEMDNLTEDMQELKQEITAS